MSGSTEEAKGGSEKVRSIVLVPPFYSTVQGKKILVLDLHRIERRSVYGNRS